MGGDRGPHAAAGGPAALPATRPTGHDRRVGRLLRKRRSLKVEGSKDCRGMGGIVGVTRRLGDQPPYLQTPYLRYGTPSTTRPLSFGEVEIFGVAVGRRKKP